MPRNHSLGPSPSYACMGRFLSMGCPTGPIDFLRRSFFTSPGKPRSFVHARSFVHVSPGHFSSSTAPQAFPRPDRGTLTPARAEAVKDGRVSAHRRLVLEGFEPDGTLERVGDDGVRGELRVGARSIVPHPCMRRAKDPDHDAGIRIGSKLRGGGPILFPGIGAMGVSGTPPPRTVIGDPSQACGQGPKPSGVP